MYPGAGIGGYDGLVDQVDGLYPGRWVNLFRETDPIGGHYVEILGEMNRVVRTGTGHSRYELTPEYREARDGGLGSNPDRADGSIIEPLPPS
jgi:hypothetical protein